MAEQKDKGAKSMLDLKSGRYETVALASEWLAVLQKSDEGKGLSPSELVKKALDDVMEKGLSQEDIKKAKTKASHSAPAEEKEEKKAEAAEEPEEKEEKKKNAKSKK